MSIKNVEQHMGSPKGTLQQICEAVKETIASWFRRRTVDYYRDPENLKWYKKEVQWVEMTPDETKKHEQIFANHTFLTDKFEQGKTFNDQVAWPKRKWLLKQSLETIEFWKLK